MKQILTLLFIFFLVTKGGNAQVDFVKATQLLEEGDYKNAKIQYLSIIESENVSPALYSNLAKTYYNLGDKVNTILYYERALKLDPGSREIAVAVNNVRQELEVRIIEIPDFIFLSWYRKIVGSISSTAWMTFQVILGIFTIVSLYGFLFGRFLTRKRMLMVVFSAFSLSILTFIFSFSSRSYEQSSDTAIITAQIEAIYQAPDILSPVVTAVAPGVKVWIEEEIGEWIKVRLRDRDTGWVRKEEVSII